MIYTGYFAKTKKYEEKGLIPVSVSLSTPTFFKGPRWTIFAPLGQDFVLWKAGDITDSEYVIRYGNHLDRDVKQSVIEKLKRMGKQKDIILCCYEKSGSFCHRYTLAFWLSSRIEMKVEEYLEC